MRAAGAVRGRATGTRELDALHPRHVVGKVDAILLTGGSAFGLGAADGGMRWLREQGRGYPVGTAGTTPIVSPPLIFDLNPSPRVRADPRPTAADAARAPVAASPRISA